MGLMSYMDEVVRPNEARIRDLTERPEREAFERGRIQGAKDMLTQVCESADDQGYPFVSVDLLRELLADCDRGEWPKGE